MSTRNFVQVVIFNTVKQVVYVHLSKSIIKVEQNCHLCVMGQKNLFQLLKLN